MPERTDQPLSNRRTVEIAGGHGSTRPTWEDSSLASRIVSALPEPVVLLRPDLTVVTVNPAFTEHFGVAADDAAGRSVFAIGDGSYGSSYGSWDAAELRVLLERRLRETGAVEEHTIAHEFGELGRRILRIAARRLDDDGLVLLAIRDVTEQDHRTRALRERERQLRVVTDAMPAMIAYVDRDLRYRFVNARYEAWFDRPRESMLGVSLDELLGDRVVEVIRPHVDTALRGERVRFDAWLPFEGGDRRFEVRYEPDTRPDGTVAGFFVLALDVSDGKRAEERVRESEERFRTLADNMSQFAWMADERGRIFWYNRRWYEYTGTTLEQVQGWGWTRVHHPDHVDRVVTRYRHSLDTGEVWEDTFPLRGVDGEYRWFLSRAVPIRDQDGRILRWLGTNTDVTKRLELEDALASHAENLEHRVEKRTRELRETCERLQATERMAMMGTLSAGLGHDMGNLLLPIRVRLDALADRDLDQDAREDLEAIRTSADYLRKLAGGLRLLALDPGRGQPRTAIDLEAWWDEASGVLRSVLPRGVELEASIEPGLSASVSRPALTQVVFNLVQNAGDAMRDRGEGRIEVRARAGEDGPLIEVRDDGPGMDPEVERRCMEPYFTTKSRGISTGFGLALVRGLLRDAGGRVELETSPGEGTSFTVRLPAGEVTPGASARGDLDAVVAVDDPRLRSLISRELQSLGLRLAGDAEHAAATAAVLVTDDADRVEAGPAGRPSLLLSDDPPPQRPNLSVLPRRPGIARLLTTLGTLADRAGALALPADGAVSANDSTMDGTRHDEHDGKAQRPER